MDIFTKGKPETRESRVKRPGNLEWDDQVIVRNSSDSSFQTRNLKKWM